MNLFLSFNGRINRAKYWLGTIILGVIFVAISVVIGLWLGLSMEIDEDKLSVIILVLQLIVLYFVAALTVKRLHDRNRPGYFAAIYLGPIIIKMATDFFGVTGDREAFNVLDYVLGSVVLVVAIWFFIELGCLRGTIGPNQYGPDPIAGKA